LSIRLFYCGFFSVVALFSPSFAFAAPQERGDVLDALPNWGRIITEYNNESPDYLACSSNPLECPSANMKAWQTLVDKAAVRSPAAQMEEVNVWFNALPYKQDGWSYGRSDHWASLREFLTHAGDCEDFAIAKYLTLRQLGFPASSMLVVMVYDVYSGTDHAFLAVDVGGVTHILDNREESTDPENFKDRYTPHFAFNEISLWTYDTPLMARSIRKHEPDVLTGNR